MGLTLLIMLNFISVKILLHVKENSEKIQGNIFKGRECQGILKGFRENRILKTIYIRQNGVFM